MVPEEPSLHLFAYIPLYLPVAEKYLVSCDPLDTNRTNYYNNRTEVFAMQRTITATELKKNLGHYLDYVMDNHDVVITKNGKKAARLSPYLKDYEGYLQLKEQSAEYLTAGPKVSYEEFMEIYEKSDLRMEFINGEIIVLGSPSTDHQEISGNLYVLLRSYLKGSHCKVFYSPFDVHFHKKDIKEPDVCQPDLLIACDLEANVIDGRYMGTPTLVIEILSPSTQRRDLVDKLNTFMLSGVKEYWIVHPKKPRVMVYSFEDHDILDFTTHQIENSFESHAFPGLEVNVSDIFAT